MKDKCNYYIEGDADATELVKKYALCVSVCPDELPVHADRSKVCKTCADATN